MATIVKTIGTALGSAGTGTVTAAASTAVVGVGTLFTTELKDGSGNPLDFQVASTIYNVASITDDTHLTLQASATFAAASFTRGSRNYSTIAAWISSLPPNLVTDGNSYIGACYNDSEFVSQNDSISGHTTDSSHTITLTAATGQGFADNAGAQTNALRYNQSNGVGINTTKIYSAGLVVGDSNVTISRLQFRVTATPQGYVVASGNNSSLWLGCIIEDQSSSGVTAPIGASGGSYGATLRNCLIITLHASNGVFLATSTLENCTIVRPGTSPSGHALSEDYGGYTVKNSAMFGFSSILSGSTTPTGSNNGTDLSSVGFGTSNQVSLTYASQFQSTAATGYDFRLKSGSGLIDNGVTDANVTTDIVGTTRPQGSAPDIGCWELVSGGVTTTVPWPFFNMKAR